MQLRTNSIVGCVVVLFASHGFAAETNFSGHWTIDLRTKQERAQKRDCGSAAFILKQTGETIVGDHTFATVGCGRLNEDGSASVQGVVVGTTAVLAVTSGRNGAMVLGTAIRQGKRLHWRTVREIRPSDSDGDSPLILDKGTLTLDASQPQP